MEPHKVRVPFGLDRSPANYFPRSIMDMFRSSFLDEVRTLKINNSP